MRIVLVNKFLYAKGGAERAVLTLGQALEERGHEVAYFGMHHADNAVAGAHVGVVRERSYRTSGAQRFLAAATMIYSWDVRRRFLNFLKAQRPQVVHFHNIYHQLTPSIIDATAELKIPSVLTLHDYKLVCPRYDLLRHGMPCEACVGKAPLACLRYRCADGSVFKSALLTLEGLVHRFRQSYAAVARFIAPSLFMQKMMISGGLAADRMVHVPNFSPSWDASSAPHSHSRFVYAGRLSPEKGVETLVRATMASSTGNLVLCGTGPLEGRLRTLSQACRERVEFRGYLGESELREQLQQAAFVAVPSEWYENAPFAILEAMAAGRAVIASDMGGIPELVENGINGTLHPAGDLTAWQQAIETAILNHEQTMEMGTRARRLSQLKFSLESHVETLEGLYGEITS